MRRYGKQLCPSCGKHFLSRNNKNGICRACEDERGVPRSVPHSAYSSRPVVCVETGKRYPSIAAAERDCGTSGNSISMALKHGYKAHGMHWRYDDGD